MSEIKKVRPKSTATNTGTRKNNKIKPPKKDLASFRHGWIGNRPYSVRDHYSYQTEKSEETIKDFIHSLFTDKTFLTMFENFMSQSLQARNDYENRMNIRKHIETAFLRYTKQKPASFGKNFLNDLFKLDSTLSAQPETYPSLKSTLSSEIFSAFGRAYPQTMEKTRGTTQLKILKEFSPDAVLDKCNVEVFVGQLLFNSCCLSQEYLEYCCKKHPEPHDIMLRRYLESKDTTLWLFKNVDDKAASAKTTLRGAGKKLTDKKPSGGFKGLTGKKLGEGKARFLKPKRPFEGKIPRMKLRGW